MSKILVGGFAAAITAVAIAGVAFVATAEPVAKNAVSASQVESTPAIDPEDSDDWESEFREGVRYGFEAEGASGVDAACEGFELMDVDTPEAFADFMASLGDDGAFLEEAFGDAGGTESVEDQLPAGVTIDDVLLIAGEEVVDICGF